MNIKVLGPGCRNCITLEQRTREALSTLGQDATITKITDVAEIVGYGVMRTPALVVDEQVVVAGEIPTVRKLATLLNDGAAG
jgi:small redox-active disulfide protein 2